MTATLTAQQESLRYAVNCLARVAAYAGHTWGGVWQNTPPPDNFELSEESIEEWVTAHSEEGYYGWGITAPSFEDGAVARVQVGRGVTVRANVTRCGEVTFWIALTSRGEVGRGAIRHTPTKEGGWEYIPPTSALPGLLRPRDVARFIRIALALMGIERAPEVGVGGLTEEEEVFIASFEEDVFGGVKADRRYLEADNPGHLLAGETDPAAVIAAAKEEAAVGNFYAARAALLGLDDEEFVRAFLEG